MALTAQQSTIGVTRKLGAQYLYVLLQGVDHLLGLEMAVDKYLSPMLYLRLDRNRRIAYFIGEP